MLEPQPVIQVVFTDQDVIDIARDAAIDPMLALERATEWAKHIQDTAAGLISEQLCSAVTTGEV